jgi:hypothetical protein
MRILHESPYFSALHDPRNDIIWIRRTAIPYASLDAISEVFGPLIAAVRPYSAKPSLTDLRQARGNNDPAWEATLMPYVKRLYGTFPVRAILVMTAAGKLQTQRLARERGEDYHIVFTDEAEAIAYLLEHRKR